jgi:hypothetical protein
MDDWAKDGAKLFVLIECLDVFACLILLLRHDRRIKLEDVIAVIYIVSITVHHAFAKLSYITVSIWKDHHAIA